ncbi:hypothetical protein GCM10025868_10620 [Angustibacter aerolatus]|uniref:Uncharacterized protein n=1 Tax=Angustibacter aerolatus TaxID=1162965 RepID=A0ABQ6JCB4_9ACTN|nr:hypothetical protein GCM10025868_10620 [Angustibacter aerolatus]
MPTSAPDSPAVWLNTTSMSSTPRPFTPYDSARAVARLSPPSSRTRLEHRALPVAHHAADALGGLGVRPLERGVRVEQRGAPGVPRQRRAASSAAASACARTSLLDARLQRLAEVGLGVRAAAQRGGDAVAPATHPLLQRAQQLAGADDLLPAGEDLAAQQRAVRQRAVDVAPGP